jgi:hypothetical protein
VYKPHRLPLSHQSFLKVCTMVAAPPLDKDGGDTQTKEPEVIKTRGGDTQKRKSEVIKRVCEDEQSGPEPKRAKLMKAKPKPCHCNCATAHFIRIGDPLWEGEELMRCPCTGCGGGRCKVRALPLQYIFNTHKGLGFLCNHCAQADGDSCSIC